MNLYVIQALGSAAFAGAIVWMSARCGTWVVRRLGLDPDASFAEERLFGLALGLGLLAGIIFIFGALGLWHPGAFLALTAALTAAAWKLSVPVLGLTVRLKGLCETAAASLAALAFAIFAIGALCPEIFYDSLHYHLAVPGLYLNAGRIIDVPTLLFSNFISTQQTLYGFLDALGGAVAAKTLHLAMGAGLAAAYVHFGRRYLAPGAGWFSAALFFGLPAAGINQITAGIDIAWSFFTFTAAYALILALEDPARRGLALAGALTGLAASIRFSGLPFLVIGALLVVWRDRLDEAHPWSHTRRHLARFLFPALVMAAPFLLRNALFHANPFYPWGATLWGHPRLDSESWRAFLAYVEAPRWDTVFSSFFSAVQYVIDPWVKRLRWPEHAFPLNPLFLLALPYIWRDDRSAQRLLRRFALGAALVWMATNPVPRLGLAAVALLSPLVAQAALVHPRSAWRKILCGLLLASSAYGMVTVARVLYNQDGWRVLAGAESEAAYLSESHASYPFPPHAAIAWMNENLPAGSNVLFIGEGRSYGLRHAATPAGAADAQPLLAQARQSSNGLELAARLRTLGITHLFLNAKEAARMSGAPFLRNLQDGNALDELWRRGVRLLWKREDETHALFVYELK